MTTPSTIRTSLYTTVGSVTIFDPRVNCHGSFVLAEGGEQKPGNLFAKKTTIHCKSSKDPSSTQLTVRVYLTNVVEIHKWSAEVVISGAGFLAFGVKGRTISLHFDAQLLKVESEAPAATGIVYGSFMGQIARVLTRPSSARTGADEDSEPVRWDVELLRGTEEKFEVIVTTTMSLKTMQSAVAMFRATMLGSFEVELTQMGYQKMDLIPIFKPISMHAVPLGMLVRSGGDATPPPATEVKRTRSLSPSPPPDDQGSSSQHRDKKLRKDPDPVLQPPKVIELVKVLKPVDDREEPPHQVGQPTGSRGGSQQPNGVPQFKFVEGNGVATGKAKDDGDGSP